MSARKVIIGCSTVAVVIVAFLVIGGIVAFKRLSAPAPLPPAVRLADSESLALGVARLEPDDPWVAGTLEELSKYSTHEQRPKEVFPLELLWTERRAAEGHEQHILSLSLSRGGRLVGLFGDLALWRAGREKNGKVSRVEYGGEGITSFPGTPIQGHLFIRDNSFVWSSDLDTAKKAVDLFVRTQNDADGVPANAGEIPRVVSLIPQGAGHILAGAILNENGSLSRSLTLLPGEALDLPAEMLVPVDHLTFTLDTRSATDGAGEIVLAFVPGTPSKTIAGLTQEFCTRLAALQLAKVTLEATPRLEESRAVITVKVGALDSVSAPLLATFARSVRSVESASSGRRRFQFDVGDREEEKRAEPPELPKDPN